MPIMKNSTVLLAVASFLFFTIPVQAQIWSQAGSDLDGEAKEDQFGNVTALSKLF